MHSLDAVLHKPSTGLCTEQQREGQARPIGRFRACAGAAASASPQPGPGRPPWWATWNRITALPQAPFTRNPGPVEPRPRGPASFSSSVTPKPVSPPIGRRQQLRDSNPTGDREGEQGRLGPESNGVPPVAQRFLHLEEGQNGEMEFSSDSAPRSLLLRLGHTCGSRVDLVHGGEFGSRCKRQPERLRVERWQHDGRGANAGDWNCFANGKTPGFASSGINTGTGTCSTALVPGNAVAFHPDANNGANGEVTWTSGQKLDNPCPSLNNNGNVPNKDDFTGIASYNEEDSASPPNT